MNKRKVALIGLIILTIFLSWKLIQSSKKKPELTQIITKESYQEKSPAKASLWLEPLSGRYPLGDVFPIEIQVKILDEKLKISAIQAFLVFNYQGNKPNIRIKETQESLNYILNEVKIDEINKKGSVFLAAYSVDGFSSPEETNFGLIELTTSGVLEEISFYFDDSLTKIVTLEEAKELTFNTQASRYQFLTK